MDSQSILPTHADVAMVFGGFASVVAALGRPLGAVLRQRFLALLFLALVRVLTCLLPIWMSNLVESEDSIWHIASFAAFGMAMVSIGSTVVYSSMKLHPRALIVLNPIANVLVQFWTRASVIVLPLNAIGMLWERGFGPYYASPLLAFCVGFMIFADVVVGEHTREDSKT